MSREEFSAMLRETHKKAFLSKRETAKELNISNGTLDTLRREGKIKSKRILGQVFFDIGEIARFMEEA